MPERSPRGQTREILTQLRAEGISDVTENQSIKAEIYAITAYFIEKAINQADEWRKSHPNQGVQRQVTTSDRHFVDSSIVPVENIEEHLNSSDLGTVLRKISFLIEGLLYQHVLAVMNPDFPSEFVNEADEDIQERLRSLLLKFRDGSTFRARDFVLSATRAPAVFIPPTLHAGMVAYQRAYQAIPVADELDRFAKQLTPIILKLAQHNIDDISQFNRKHFGIISPANSVPVRAFDTVLQLERVDEGYRFRFPEIETYKNPGTDEEPTIGCPAVYSQVNSQNAIRYVIGYATDLLRQSGIYR